MTKEIYMMVIIIICIIQMLVLLGLAIVFNYYTDKIEECRLKSRHLEIEIAKAYKDIES